MYRTALFSFLFGTLTQGASIPRAYGEPSANGFPNPDAAQQMAIAKQAGGLLPNGPLPTALGAGSTTALQLIAFNELFEVAYFNSLLHNVTHGAHGYEAANKREVAEVIRTVRAQEEQHALGALAILNSAKAFAPAPCQYQFPVATLKDALALAETFTSVVLGALQGANRLFAADNLPALIQIISSVIGNEAEQNGFYHTYLKQIPSDSPFLTPVPAPFAWTALQLFVVPGSCPFPLSNINLPIFPGLTVNGGPVAVVKRADQKLSFSADLADSANAQPYLANGGMGLYLTYTSGQQLPFSVALEDVKVEGTMISFMAEFPFTEHVMEGFSHAALTTCNTFDSSDAVADSALAGPAVIQALKPLAG